MAKREGPSVGIKVDCWGCEWEVSEGYAVQGDSGRDYYCVHPDNGQEGRARHIGDCRTDTPKWCPVLEVVLRAKLEEALRKVSNGSPV